MRTTVFLSHSSKDKPAVRKLAQALKDNRINVWFDESEIGVGDRITKSIEEGLTRSDFVCIWLTRYAITSGWVEREWQSKLQDEVKLGQTFVLPLLAEECNIPPFLMDKRYADFRDSFARGLEELLQTFARKPMPYPSRTVSNYTIDLLADLENVAIPIPYLTSIKLVQRLRRMPRSGKKIRLESFRPEVPIRSIYDHMLSTAHSADVLLNTINHGLTQYEYLDLARCIVYHDLCEIFLGDIPAFTNLSDAKRNRVQILAEQRLRDFSPTHREHVVNDFIHLFLGEKERESMSRFLEITSEPTNGVARFFHVLDRIDPIVAVWRYLYQFRGRLGQDGSEFLRRLKDFFDYDAVKKVTRDYKEDLRLYELVLNLQTRDSAQKYYSGRPIHDTLSLFQDQEMPESTIIELIQGCELIFATQSENTIARKTKKKIQAVK